MGCIGPGATSAGCLLPSANPRIAGQQQHTAYDQADDRCSSQGVCDRAQITEAGQVDDHHLARVARAVVGRHGVADLRRLAAGEGALAGLLLALIVGVADRDDYRVALADRLHRSVDWAGIA